MSRERRGIDRGSAIVEFVSGRNRAVPIRSRDNSGGSPVIKQPHTLENYRNGQESCNKETREDKARTQVTILSRERAALLSFYPAARGSPWFTMLPTMTSQIRSAGPLSEPTLLLLRYRRPSLSRSPGLAYRCASTAVTFVVQIVTIDRRTDSGAVELSILSVSPDPTASTRNRESVIATRDP